MDDFIEYLIKKQPTGRDWAMRLLVLFGTVVVCCILLVLGRIFLEFSIILLALCAGAIYLGWRLFTSFDLEYEYIVTNGEMDVDKIIAQRKRKREVTLKFKDIEIMAPIGPAHQREFENPSFQTKIEAGNPAAPGAYFIAAHTEKRGYTRLVFEPDERIVESAKRSAPRKVFTE
jgi:hypothetical protein